MSQVRPAITEIRQSAVFRRQPPPEAPPPTDTDESKPALKKRGRNKKKVVQCEVIDVDVEPASPDETPP